MQRPSMRSDGWLSLGLVVYGNAKAWLDLMVLGTGAGGSAFGVCAGLAFVALLLVLARRAGWRAAELGLDSSYLRQAIWTGLRIGIPIAVVLGCLGLVVGLSTGSAGAIVQTSPAARADWPELLRRAAVWLWLDTALPEELAFRGALLGLLLRAWSSRLPAVMLSALAFTLWHVVVVWQDGPAAWWVLALKLGAIYVGGVYFAALRLQGGHLASSVIAHWAFDAAAFVSVRLMR